MNMATQPRIRPAAAVLALSLILGALSACGGQGALRAPVMPTVLPSEAPDDLKIPDAVDAPTVLQDGDGYLYIVGAADDKSLSDAKVGDGFVLRHGGHWQESIGERPTLGYVRVARKFAVNGQPLLLVQPELLLKDADPVGARIAPWTSDAPPIIGKGLVKINAISGDDVELSLGFLHGVQPGDRFIALAPHSGRVDERMGDRVVGVLKVTDADERGSTAQVLVQGGVRSGSVSVGQWAFFASPGMPDAPLPGTIQVGQITGGDAALQAQLVDHLNTYLGRLSGEQFKAEAIDVAVDPLDPRFGRRLAGMDHTEKPRMLLSGRVVERDGDDVLVLNYTNTGLSVAHGMIAATPEQGIVVGSPSDIDRAALQPAFHNLVAAALAHRGQVAEALYLLEVVLHQGGWDGPARWHARDQLSMRWSQTGRIREALRMVHQDVARGDATEDKPAVINAVGTLMPLYEDIGMKERGMREAERFYTLREALGEGFYTDHAWRSWIERLVRNGRTEDAEAELGKFTERCQPVLEAARAEEDSEMALMATCASELFSLYRTMYWQLPPDREPRERQSYLDRAEGLASELGDTYMASIRLTQGVKAIRGDDHDGALIAFMEAERLFRKDNFTPGIAEIDTLLFNLRVSQGDRQSAYDIAMSSANRAARFQDVQELASIFRMVIGLYLDVPKDDLRTASYVRNAGPTMVDALNFQLGANDIGSAAEVYYVSGRYRIMENPEEAAVLLSRAVTYGIQSARFDIASMSQIFLALLSKRKGSNAEFMNHLEMAKEFARLSGDPALLQTIIRIEQNDNAPSDNTL